MTGNHEEGRPGPPAAGDETANLLGSLERQRAIFAWKCGGLDAAGLRAALGPSSMTLGGLLKHLALVEDEYFSHRLPGRDPAPPWDTVDWDADPDWDFTSAADDAPDELYALWDSTIARSRARLAAAVADGGMDQSVHMGIPGGQHANLRRLVCDLIEEYGRHTGHADRLREAVDGVTGEDPPSDWRPVSGDYRMPGGR